MSDKSQGQRIVYFVHILHIGMLQPIKLLSARQDNCSATRLATPMSSNVLAYSSLKYH